MESPKPLVIGVGNRDRGDDGIGPAVAEALAHTWSEHLETAVVAGDLSALAMRWQPDQQVVVVDAMVSGEEPGTVIEFDCSQGELPVDHRPVSSHSIGLAQAVELARTLDRMPRQLTLLAVEGADFEPMTAMSGPVADALEVVVHRVGTLFGIAAERDLSLLDRVVQGKLPG